MNEKTKAVKQKESMILDQRISIHWWNFRSKTVDFEGTLRECLKEKKITFKRIQHKEHPDVFGYRFKYEQGSSKMTYEYWSDFYLGALKVITFQMVYLGDKATVNFMGYSYTFRH